MSGGPMGNQQQSFSPQPGGMGYGAGGTQTREQAQQWLNANQGPQSAGMIGSGGLAQDPSGRVGGMSWRPDQMGASYNNSSQQMPQRYEMPQQRFQNYGMQQGYGQGYGQMPPWIGNLMSMFQRPGMGYQGGQQWSGPGYQQWSNPNWQPPPAPVPQQSQGTTIGGAPISNPPSIVQQYNDLTQVKQQKAAEIDPNAWWQAGGSGSW